MNKQDVLDAFRFRHACKEFDPERRVSDEDFAYILETGRLSPSSFGFEPWKFVVLQNAELRSRLLPVTWGGQKSIPTASHLLLLLTRTRNNFLPDSTYIARLKKDIQKMPEEMFPGFQERLRAFLTSDFKLLDNERAMFEWASRQTYIALGNMMTAAALQEIDSCPIEGFDKDAVEGILREAGILEGDAFGLSCMVAFGYRVREPREKTRRCVEEVVQWVN
ncbi:NAD(P)H-dependent oxidoreductase [Paenibacillus sp.]|uniref:NAD(P)H-dependent oxidoreductase n=1 Tax=Paenibacillus sp. TaxID=58172 RepID=UPI002811AA49|nr:NAD(P)H-dependent oxidoreductase [Paenibacillus sp.]